MKDEPKKDQHHFFTSSCATWCVDDNLLRCIERQREEDEGVSKGCNVFKVPCDIDDDYEINLFQPQVEGTIFIDHVTYEDG